MLLTFIIYLMYLSMYNKPLLRNFMKSKSSKLKIRQMWSVFYIWVSAFFVNKKKLTLYSHCHLQFIHDIDFESTFFIARFLNSQYFWMCEIRLICACKSFPGRLTHDSSILLVCFCAVSGLIVSYIQCCRNTKNVILRLST